MLINDYEVIETSNTIIICFDFNEEIRKIQEDTFILIGDKEGYKNFLIRYISNDIGFKDLLIKYDNRDVIIVDKSVFNKDMFLINK